MKSSEDHLVGLIMVAMFVGGMWALFATFAPKNPTDYCRPDSVMVEVHGNFYKCGEK